MVPLPARIRPATLRRVGPGGAGLAPQQRPPRRRSRGRGAARPTARRPRSRRAPGRCRRAGAPAPRPGRRRGRAPGVWRKAIRSTGLAVRSSTTRSRAFARVRTLSAVSTTPSIDRDDRLDREDRGDRGPGRRDAAALAQVLDRVEGHVEVDVRDPRPDPGRDLGGRDARPRPARPPARARSPTPIEAEFGVHDVDLPLGQALRGELRRS